MYARKAHGRSTNACPRQAPSVRSFAAPPIGSVAISCWKSKRPVPALPTTVLVYSGSAMPRGAGRSTSCSSGSWTGSAAPRSASRGRVGPARRTTPGHAPLGSSFLVSGIDAARRSAATRSLAPSPSGSRPRSSGSANFSRAGIPMSENEVGTAREVAKLLRVNRKTVYEAFAAGDSPRPPDRQSHPLPSRRGANVAEPRPRCPSPKGTTMSVRRRRGRNGGAQGKWMVHIEYTHPDGRRQTVRKVSPVQTRRGAERYERELRQALLDGTYDRRSSLLRPTSLGSPTSSWRTTRKSTPSTARSAPRGRS